MRISPGRYVRAIFDFQTSQAGEIPFKTGEIILVTKVIDENWVCGIQDKSEGNFPVNFVEEINVPQTSNGQKLFVAIETFKSRENGDLNFNKGEIILGLKAIDENWWNGHVGNKTGIFPKTFVKNLPVVPRPTTQDETTNSKIDTADNKSKSGSSVHVPFSATALVDVTPQLDEELGFKAGNVLTIIEIVDDDWLNAELNGKVGLVSPFCVDLPKNFNPSKNRTNSFYSYLNTTDSHSSDINESHKSETYNSTFETQESYKYDITNEPYRIGPAGNVYAYLDAYNESIENNGNACEKTPLYSYTSENTRSSDTEITPYARVLYPFVSQSNEELTINENDIVTLIQHADPDWIEGELDGRIGLFPTSYVEVIVDCPYAYNQLETNNQQTDNDNKPVQNSDQKEILDQTVTSNDHSTPSKIDNEPSNLDITPECDQISGQSKEGSPVKDNGIPCNDLALVRFSIDAQTEWDLSIREGDTITIINRYEDNWLQAKDENGNIGLVPSNYVVIIKEGPEVPELSSSSAIINQHNNSLTTSHNSELCSQSISESEELELKHSILENVSGYDNEVVSDSDTVSSGGRDAESLSTKSNSSEDLSKLKKPVPLPKPQLAPKPFLKPKPTLPAKPTIKPKVFTNASINQTGSTLTEKVFPKIDPTKSLDSIITNELSKAKQPSKGETKVSKDNDTRSSVTFSESASKRGDLFSATDVLQSMFSSKPEIPARTNKLHKTTLLNHEDFSQSRTSPKFERQRPSKPPRPKSVSFSRSSFYLNDAYVAENDEVTLAQKNRSFKNKSTRTPPPRPNIPSKSVERSRQVPDRPAPIAPGKRITPGRPAPPRPTSTVRPKKRLSTSQSNLSGSDLMTFSPEEQAVITEDEGNEEVIADLKKRISEIERDLQKYVQSKEDVILMLKTVTGEKEEEINENLGFYKANISGLSEELIKLKENLYEVSPKERRAGKMKEEIERRQEEEKQRKEEEKIQCEKEREKRKEKRQKIIDEILDTEKIFLRYLQFTMETFLGQNCEKESDVDYERLFGNMEEIADVSQRFLTSLENAVNGKSFQDQIVGTSFVKFAEDMKNTYAPYCRNHDEVIQILKKYKADPHIHEYFQRTINSMREYLNVFDLDALLIKPVQRILKYPLLISELLRVTEDDHKDKEEVTIAIHAITDVAKAINEYKRRKDLVYKYKKESDASFGDMISKLSLHTLKKKSNRMRGRLSTTMGISLQTKDENFEREENKFRLLEKCVKVLLKDVQTYIDTIQESVSCQESCVVSIEDYYGDKCNNQVNRFKTLYQKIASEHFPELRSTLEQLVIIPLNSLIVTFNGPIKVIEKRFDKLLDYDNLFKKSKDTEKYNEALKTAKNDYEAMNAQLLDELPKLYNLAFKVFRDCVSCFVQAQKKYLDVSLQETYTELELPLNLGSGESFIETFNVQHTTVLDRISGLNFIPRGFNPKYDSLHRQDSIRAEKKNKRVSLDAGSSKTSAGNSNTVQSESQKVYVIQLFTRDKLYQACNDYMAPDLMDLSLQQGTVVGVLKEQDPMGNKDKWFVDDGASKGFVHKSSLTPFHQETTTNSGFTGYIGLDTAYDSFSIVSDNLGDSYISGNLGDSYISGNLGDSYISGNLGDSYISGNLGDSSGSGNLGDSYNIKLQQEMDSILDELDEADDYIKPEIHEFHYSEFSFSARTSNEVSLFEGQVVTVLAKHDQDGNTEWWYVDADGNHGYAPSSYLKPM